MQYSAEEVTFYLYGFDLQNINRCLLSQTLKIEILEFISGLHGKKCTFRFG